MLRLLLSGSLLLRRLVFSIFRFMRERKGRDRIGRELISLGLVGSCVLG